ncbi:hypothetical protein GEMRC1_001714 [Eukaryota sp. GEM-RC1]
MMLHLRKLHKLDSLNHSRVSFVQPSSLVLFRLGSIDDAKEVSNGCKLSEAELILFALNDIDITETSRIEGGTHWSALFYYAPSQTFYHIDSLATHNSDEAYDVATRLSIILGLKSPEIEEVECTQQLNGNDCGVFCIAFLERAIQAYLNSLTEPPSTGCQVFDDQLHSFMLENLCALKTRNFIWDCISDVITETEKDNGIHITLKPPC